MLNSSKNSIKNAVSSFQIQREKLPILLRKQTLSPNKPIPALVFQTLLISYFGKQYGKRATLFLRKPISTLRNYVKGYRTPPPEVWRKALTYKAEAMASRAAWVEGKKATLDSWLQNESHKLDQIEAAARIEIANIEKGRKAGRQISDAGLWVAQVDPALSKAHKPGLKP